MKSILYSSLFLLLTLMPTLTQAQTLEKAHEHNYVVLTKKVPQLKPILLTAEALKQEDAETFGEFQVIFCGKNIGELTDASKMDQFIKKAEELGVQLVACGFSLNKFKVDKSKLPKTMKIVENGILHNFQLQKKGFQSLSL